MPLFQLNKVVYDDKGDSSDGTDPFVDIVALHGLNENMFDAWTDPDTKTLWLRDLLPENIQIARVLTFGYNAYASSFYGSSSIETIQQHAHTLVADLQADRSLEDCLQRPIIFICHGLGGILVKRALAYSSTRTSKHVDHLYSIFVSTYAIMFFGTPHNGSDKASWLSPSQIIHGSELSGHPARDNQLISSIEKESEALQTITDQFAPLMKQFHIFFFWEELQSEFPDGMRFVVEEHSAAPIIGNTERSGIHSTHSEMIRFSTKNSSSYRTVIEALARYSRNAPSVIASRQKQAALALAQARSQEALELTGTAFNVHSDNKPFQFQLKTSEKFRNKHFTIPQFVSKDFTGREKIYELVKGSLFPHGGTILSQHQRIFIIYGIGGSGKTQFCSKFAQDHREKYWGVFYLDATSIETAKHSLAKIGKLGGLEATADAGKHWLSNLDESWLLIINNADDPKLKLESIFPEGGRGHILVTTRNPEFRVHATVGSTEFKGLAERDALLLLLKSAEVQVPWDPSTEATGNLITKTLGYLALSLVQAGAQIRQRLCDLKGFIHFWDKSRRLSRRDPSTYAEYSTWELSIDSLEQRRTEASQDAAQLLSIVAFFHFERIPVDVFIRAVNNRATYLKGSRQDPFSTRALHAIRNRLLPPPNLPYFLRQGSAKMDPYRVRKALHELWSLSLIAYDGRDATFSLHPVVHAWARDRLETGEKRMWAELATNTLAESIVLPPGDVGEVHEDFRRDILPHLDICLNLCLDVYNADCRVQIPDYEAGFPGSWPSFMLIFRYIPLLYFREQVLKAAKFGYVYLERGRFKDAAELLLMVKDALVKSSGYENEKTMRAMLVLAQVYWGLGRLEEAIELQKLVVEARKKVFKCQHRETLLAMDQLGRSFWLNGQYHEAIEIQTLTKEGMKRTLGTTNGDTLEAMDNFAVTLGSWHRFEESAAVHRKVLKFRQTELGHSHLDTLTTMNNLAMALLDLKETEEAQDLMHTVFEERKKKLGKEHPWTLWALCNLAKIRLERGYLKEAEEMLIPGIAAAKRSLGENHLGVLMGCGVLARVFARQKRFEDAEKLLRETIESLEVSRGLEHPDTVYALWNMSILLEQQGKLREAVEIGEVAVERVHMRLTTKHPLGEKIQSHLSRLLGLLEPQGESQCHEDDKFSKTIMKFTRAETI